MNPSTTYWRTRTSLDLQEDLSPLPRDPRVDHHRRLNETHEVWQLRLLLGNPHSISHPSQDLEFIFPVLIRFVCLFVCFKPHEQFFSYLAAVTITGDRAANLGLCSALRAFKQGGIFTMPHLLRHGASVYTVSSERPAPTSHSGIKPPTQGSSDHCARSSNHCATRAMCSKEIP
jgi:hypothetical protein